MTGRGMRHRGDRCQSYILDAEWREALVDKRGRMAATPTGPAAGDRPPHATADLLVRLPDERGLCQLKALTLTK